MACHSILFTNFSIPPSHYISSSSILQTKFSLFRMTLMDFLFNPISFTAIISLLILAISVINFHARRSPKNPKKHHPVAGTSIHQLVNFHRLHDFMTELSSKHRTYRLLDLNRAVVYTQTLLMLNTSSKQTLKTMARYYDIQLSFDF